MKWAFSWGRSKKVSSINNGDIEALHNLVNGLTNKVNELSANLANYVTLTNANNLFVSKTQPIVLDASRDKPVKINGSTKNPVFIEFVRNNTNLGYVGLGSGNNNNINVGARSGDLCLEVSTGNKIVVNNSVIQGVANPVNNTDVANKQYVDNLTNSNATNISNLTTRVTALEKSGGIDNEWYYVKGYVDLDNDFTILKQGTNILVWVNQLNINNKTYDLNSIDGNAVNVLNWSITDSLGYKQWDNILPNGNWIPMNQSIGYYNTGLNPNLDDTGAGIGGNIVWFPFEGSSKTFNIDAGGSKLRFNFTLIFTKNAISEYQPPKTINLLKKDNETTQHLLMVTKFEKIGNTNELMG